MATLPSIVRVSRLGFVERALGGDCKHCKEIVFSRSMRLLTAKERRKLPMQTHTQEGGKVVSANKVNTNPENEQICLPPQKIERSRSRQESQPRKRRRTHEVAVFEERVHRAALINLRSPNSRARSKMKARRLILEADNSTESRAAASRRRYSPKAGAEMNRVRENEASLKENLQTSAVSPTPIVSSRATRKEKGKAIMTDEEDLVALKKVVERVVEDVVEEVFAPQKVLSPQMSTGTVILEPGQDPLVEETQLQVLSAIDLLCGQVLLLLQYLNRKRGKYAGTTINVSYVELVRNRTRAKVAATSAAASKESQTPETKAKYEVLWKRLTKEVKKRRYLEKTYEGLREDIENAKCATIDLWNRLEASRTVYNTKL
ncbi:hypothetical protein AXG93_4293s1010 [Marchantia polymorpha subsp. ruderalis]|uniref:Uncharacterized protein n=1 Tax=Marchantia polymorpha subsp. ruderalis TaxID=1480154 RepID=A0A176WJ41_MARPO|nr:hypothetical protein AXG93_4293s1010 [Marchantia polymorpha subsp. ruderalis]